MEGHVPPSPLLGKLIGNPYQSQEVDGAWLANIINWLLVTGLEALDQSLAETVGVFVGKSNSYKEMQIDKETQIDHQQTNSDIRETQPDNREMQNDHGKKQNDDGKAQNWQELQKEIETEYQGTQNDFNQSN